MIDSSDLRHIIVVFIVIAMLIIQGLRMLVKPASIHENTLTYRYIFQRFFRHLDKEVERTGKLTYKHIQIYGLILMVSGLLLLGIALIMLLSLR
ncbi:MAG TPA: hypothetical protein PLH19_13910 [Anaerolineae bacterium]|nr:hypothetical protein [Anaerolineae bacterium]HQH39611.1 hypothetical protein [Anaerolineae bacterium]